MLKIVSDLRVRFKHQFDQRKSNHVQKDSDSHNKKHVRRSRRRSYCCTATVNGEEIGSFIVIDS